MTVYRCFSSVFGKGLGSGSGPRSGYQFQLCAQVVIDVAGFALVN